MARIGYETYAELVADAFGAKEPDAGDAAREATMAYHLVALRKQFAKVLFVGGLAHVRRVERRVVEAGEADLPRPLGRTKREGVEVFHLHEDASREVLSEPGWLQGLFEASRGAEAPPFDLADKYAAFRELFERANDRMHAKDGERVDAHLLRIAHEFGRRQALVRGGLAPSLFEMTAAARGVHSDDFAWHVWDLANTYPHQADPADLATLRVTLEDLARTSRDVIFRRRIKTRRHTLRLVRTRKKERVPGEWQKAFDGHSLCSYPPEDLRIESFGLFLRKKARGLLSSEHTRTMPFLATLADGVDLRKTIKNMAHDGRLFVKEERATRGDVGAVIVIFDGDDDARYPWTMTWQGEHEAESDMALFATLPTENVVGPGIGRAEYGGFLMTHPPGRLFHVFEDKYFDDAENHAERLLEAGIDYANDRWIVYVAKKPPRARVARRARRMGKQVMYLPIGQLSPLVLRELRVVHVLDGREVRGWAKSFIG